MDRRAFTLQPLIAQGILHPGDNRLSCAVGGIDYFAGKMPENTGPMHRFLLGAVQSGLYDRHNYLGHNSFCTVYVDLYLCQAIISDALLNIPS